MRIGQHILPKCGQLPKRLYGHKVQKISSLAEMITLKREKMIWGSGFHIWTPFRTRKVKKCPKMVKPSIGDTNINLTISMELSPS